MRLVLGVIGLALVAGCGARTDLARGRDAGRNESGVPDASGDAAADPCTPIFGDCDGTVEDCARAFARGCTCGPAPAVRVGPHDRVLAMSSLFWTGERLALGARRLNDPDDPIGHLYMLDPSGTRSIAEWPLPAVFGASEGSRLYSVQLRPAPGLIVLNADSGEFTERPVDLPGYLGDLWQVPVGGGDLVVMWRQGDGTSWAAGLLEEGRSSCTRVAGPFPARLRAGRGATPAWDGTRVLLVDIGLAPYLARTWDPFGGEVTGPFVISESGGLDQVAIVPTRLGWLVAGERRFTGELVLLPLTPEGAPAGPEVVWRDPDATTNSVRFSIAEHGGGAAIVFTRYVATRGPAEAMLFDEPLFGISIAPNGSIVGGPRTIAANRWVRVVPATEPAESNVVWAGYSFAIAYTAIAEDGLPDTWVQRICP